MSFVGCTWNAAVSWVWLCGVPQTNATWFLFERASQLLGDRRFEEARTLLETAINQMPAGWSPVSEDAKALTG